MLSKELFDLLGKDKKYVYFLTLISLAGTFASVGVTACVCACIYLAEQGGTDVSKYALYIGVALICAAVKAVSVVFDGKLKNSLGSKVKKDLRDKAYRKLLALGVDGSKEGNAALTQMIIEGVEQIDTYYSRYLPSFFFAMTAPIFLFAICVSLEWRVGVTLLACLPLIPVSIVLVSKWAKKIFAKYWGKYTSMGNAFLDNIQGMKELKIFGADGKKQIETKERAEEFRAITMKVLVMQLCSLTIIDTVAFGGAGVAIVFALKGAVATVEPLGWITALFLILISAEFFLPMISLASAFHVAMNGATAGKKIKMFLELPEEKWGENKPDRINEIAMCGVTFSYDGERKVLKNVDMSFKQGFNAIVGESGSGKSTAVSLILGSRAPESGTVEINGRNLKEYVRAEYYSHVASVSYNTFIFNASVKENFRLSKPDITDDEIYKVLEAVNLRKFVQDAGGLDYVVLEDSENISGGQRQRLALAINLAAEKDVYIFDEATSNIDVESEAVIMKNVHKLAQDKIVIMISHRLQNVADSKNIYMLDNGSVIESGTHDRLLRNNGNYARVFNKQYGLENGYKEAGANA